MKFFDAATSTSCSTASGASVLKHLLKKTGREKQTAGLCLQLVSEQLFQTVSVVFPSRMCVY